ncbi:MAG: hypothetical protein ABIE70_04715 [bacterium]
MKYLITAICVLALATFAFAGDEEDHEGHAMTEAPWFDMVNCGFCKHLTEEAGFLEYANWENFVIDNGMMSVTTVPEEHMDALARINAKMEESGKKMETGEMIPMCGMCASMGQIFMSGKAKYSTYKIKNGEVALFTSSDPETIKAIQAHAKHTIDEYAKVMAAEVK